ncbi:MAG: hypothetical protein COB69_02005 [Phycisphaera sp.]|nr:MAG: hypothetical protein COB69_02005 [Phycisphaera sp.]
MRTILPALLACALAFLSTFGCAKPVYEPSQPHAFARGETRPPRDFALAVTVFGQPTHDQRNTAQEPARFVIQPDGVLRAAQGSGVSLDTFPPRTRTLTQPQIANLYAQIVRNGLDRGVGGSPLNGTTPPAIEPGDALIVIEFTAHDSRRVHVYDANGKTQVSALVRTLRQLARLDQ